MAFFFFNDTATTDIYTLSLHDALPIFPALFFGQYRTSLGLFQLSYRRLRPRIGLHTALLQEALSVRSEEHTSELQSRQYLVCRLLLEKTTKEMPSLKLSRCSLRAPCIS